MITQPKSIIAEKQLKAMQDLALGSPPGAICEVGVYHGGSALRLYEVAIRQGRELHLFDTFTGTPVFDFRYDHHKINEEFADHDAPERIRTLMPLADLHVGVYPETHPENLGEVAFIHCDCDQYASYRAVIDHLWPLVVPGGSILFDDYPYLAGAKQAVEESFSQSELKLCFARRYVVKGLADG